MALLCVRQQRCELVHVQFVQRVDVDVQHNREGLIDAAVAVTVGTQRTRLTVPVKQRQAIKQKNDTTK